jgi:ABC-type glycerol-3-phosphate transport system substrate-binding protein
VKNASGKKGSRRRLCTLAVALTLFVTSVHAVAEEGQPPSAGMGTTAVKPLNQGTVGKTQESDTFEPFYSNILADWLKKGYTLADSELKVPAVQFSAQSGTSAASGSYGGRDQVLVWNNDKENWIEYKLEIPQSALYEMHLEYHPFQEIDSATGRKRETRRSAILSVAFDGKYSFQEARAISFERQWRDVQPIRKDENGDEIRPNSIEVPDWLVKPFRDSGGAYAEPLKWYLTKGIHTIRLTSSESIVLQSLKLSKPAELKPYGEVAGSYPEGELEAGQQPIIIEAEQMSIKNDSAIQIEPNQDPGMSPRAYGYNVFNSVGGLRWFRGGQSIAWNFEVPESGRYKLGMRTLQRFATNKSSFRNIYIDGKIPFQEFLAYRFPYERSWNGTMIASGEGKPYELYLEKGKHTLTMEATHAPFKPAIIALEEVSKQLRDIDQDLKFLTGIRQTSTKSTSDRNRTWNAARDFPDLPGKLEQVRTRIGEIEQQLVQANGVRDDTANGLRNAVKDLDRFLQYPNEIPYRVDELTSLQSKVSSYRLTLEQQHLQLDRIYIIPSDAKPPTMEASLWSKAAGAVHNFYMSFVRKDNAAQVEEGSLNVWVSRGRDYVNLLQELADEQFTPQFGKKVKVNLLPREDLLILANSAGITPDVALGISQDKAVDFAIRGAVQDLTEFEDFPKLQENYAPGALIPFYYNKGFYALPETQSFQVLFYRKDIMQQLNLKVPDTWNDVYDILPTIQQNNYNFFVPPNQFVPFFYQNGAEFYAKDGTKSALDSPEAFKAFKQWTDNFLIYGMPREVPSFYEHFRRGTIPIGIADYNLYVQLTVAAPELTGWWEIAPMPGVKQPDGSVSRWAAGGQQAGMIYKNSDNKEMAWEFMKWWLSAEVQERYGSDLEAFYGPSFRWNTGNVDAFVRLPWKKAEANVILQQWKWYKEMPNLPGGYFTAREINNAWNRSVVNTYKENARSSLEQTVIDVNRELQRKLREFNYIDEEGRSIKTLDLPVINKPWEGVDQYVGK